MVVSPLNFNRLTSPGFRADNIKSPLHSSPFSKYGSGLKIVDRQGNFYGYFSRSYGGETKVRKILNTLWENTDGDYDLMRDTYCS